MHTQWLVAVVSVLSLVSICPVVSAERYAVLPRQNDRMSTSSVASSSSAASSSTTTAASTKKASPSPLSSITTAGPSATNTDTKTSSSVVLGATATPVANGTYNDTIAAKNAVVGLPIQPELTPALAVAGALLIITAVFYTVIGIKTKWLHIFLSTAYLSSLAVTILIVYVMHPPISNAIQGAYFVAACLTGILFGGLAVVFDDVTEGLGCFLGGFCLSMWLLVLKPGGLVTSKAGKAIFIACFTLGAFSLYISHHTRPYGLIGSTSFAGATIIVLGIDCFSRAGLKEFWLYIWNLNDGFFPLYYQGPYPITRGIQVEVAAIFLLSLLGVMSQMKVWKIIKKRREERASEQRRKELQRNQADDELGRRLEEGNGRDRAMWDAIYGDKETKKAPQADSGVGTDEPSTRKGSMTVIDGGEAVEEGIELQDLASARKEPSKGGQATDDAAQGDETAEASVAQHQDSGSIPRALPENSTLETNEGGSKAEDLPANGPTNDPRTLVDPNMTLKPQYVPLPFKVPTQDSQPKDDDASSIATFAPSEIFPDRSSKRLSRSSEVMQNCTPKRTSGSSFMRNLSNRSKRSWMVVNVSEEALMVPHVDDDCASSVAATLDGASDSGRSSPEVSAGGQSPTLSASKPEMTAQSPAPGPLDVPDSAAEFILPAPTETPRADVESKHSRRSTSSSSAASREGKDATEKQEKTPSVMSAADSQTERIVARLSLTGNLPETGASKVVLAYRTNEWAKHLSNAENPSLDDLTLEKKRASLLMYSKEDPVCVNVNALQQTALTAPIAPEVTQSWGDRAQLPSINRSTSGPSKNPYFNQQSRSNSQKSLPQPIDRSPSQVSLSSVHNGEDLPQSSVPRQRASQISIVPARNHRSSSSPLLNSPLVSSPIEEGVESSFANPRPSQPTSLIAQRDTIIKNKPSSTSFVRDPSSSYPPVLPPLDEDDTISLSQRRSLLRQASQRSTSHPTPGTLPRKSLPQRTGPVPNPRESTISAWRASLRPSVVTTVQNQEIEHRRAELLAEKRRRSQTERQGSWESRVREGAVEIGMRKGSMLDLHREAMRKMQGQANRGLSGGAA